MIYFRRPCRYLPCSIEARMHPGLETSAHISLNGRLKSEDQCAPKSDFSVPKLLHTYFRFYVMQSKRKIRYNDTIASFDAIPRLGNPMLPLSHQKFDSQAPTSFLLNKLISVNQYFAAT